MIIPIVASRRGAIIPMVLPIICSILDAVIREDVVIDEIIRAIHQIDACDLIFVYVVLGYVTAGGAAHAQSEAAILAKEVPSDPQFLG